MLGSREGLSMEVHNSVGTRIAFARGSGFWNKGVQ
jgi:hypothetical protein